VLRRLTPLRRLRPLAPAAMLALLVLVPSYYAQPDRREQRKVLRDMVGHLAPHRALIADPGTRFVGPYGHEFGAYIAHKAEDYYDHAMLDGRPPGQTVESFLEEKDLNLIYLEEGLLQRLAATDPGSPFLGNTGNARWKLVGCGDLPGDRWKLFRRTP
jgi:hypothetical protein